jgi:TolA-binding protein
MGPFVAAVLLAALATAAPALPQAPQDQAARLLLDGARRAYNEKNYPFAAGRFREFLAKYGGHKEAPAARYGLALCLLEGPQRDYNAAADNLQPLAGNKNLPERPFVLYYLGLARRGQGVQALSEANAKPQAANQYRNQARQRFEEAAVQFAAAAEAFVARVKNVNPEAKELPADLEWAARARCDRAEMLLRAGKAKVARDAAASFVADKRLSKSRYHGLGLYYHGFACFLLKDHMAAGRSLTMLAPFEGPVFGTHARYLLARVHHAAGERPEAQGHYEGVLADHAKQKKAAEEALRQPDRFKNDPEERARLERLARGPAPDHVARATFFLGVMQYEDGRFAEALNHLSAFAQQFPQSPLAAEAQLRRGFCQVQLKQFADAQRTLQPLADKEPRLADQALLWLAKAQAGAAAPNNPQALRTALETFRRAADRAGQMAGANPPDPQAKVRRAEALAEMADTQQLARQYREAAATYNQILNERSLPQREQELLQHLATALQLAGDYTESDKAVQRFREAHPKSVLLPAVLFRHAENAYLQSLAAAKLPNPADRKREEARLTDEAIKRYQVVADKYPEFAHANLARYGLALCYYRKGDLEKAREHLEKIPAAERNGELAAVPYQLADVLLRLAPARADDAVAAGKLEEQLKGAIEMLEGFVGAQPNGPQTADALLKLGYCQQRLAGLLAQPPEQAKAVAAARAAYEQILQRFGNGPVAPQARFERAKCLALAKDVNGAINELRNFTRDPLQRSAVAPMAVLHLATLLRGQNKAQEAADVLAQCRRQHEADLLKDPTRAAWVPLLQYQYGIALREAGKRAEARAILEGVVKTVPDRPEAWEAALRAGQCLKDDAQQKITEAGKRLAGNLPPAQQAAARKQLDDGLREMRDAMQYLTAQAEALKQKKPAGEEAQRALAQARARLLYEAAWGSRALADEEIRSAREKMPREAAVPTQPAEKTARGHYRAVIDGFADLPLATDARFELAELLSDRGEHDEAIKLLRDALDKEPPPELTDKVRLRLGAALQAKGDVKGALAQFGAVAQNPKSPLAAQAIYREGECFLHMNQPAEAAKRLALFRDRGEYQNLPGLTDRALLRLGYALAQAKQWDQSRQAYEQVVGRFGNGPWAHEARYGIGWAHQNQGRYDDAVNAYTQVTKAAASELGARAQLNVGLCRLAQKRYADASTALLVVPYTYDYPHLSAIALVEAARAFAENKQKDQAIKLLKRVLRDHPDTAAAEAARKRLQELTAG